MSTHLESSTKRSRSVLYIVSMVLLVVFAVIGLLMFKSARDTQQALEKADQLIASINQAGGTAPSREQIARVLGDDGGAVCANPNNALSRAVLFGQLANGAAGPGTRPVIADSGFLQGQLRIIQIYCPEELDEFQKFVDELQTHRTGGA
jgi:Tfp pilus assembly protein FimT